MKKIYSIFIAVLLTFTLVGCNNNEKESTMGSTKDNIGISIVINEGDKEISKKDLEVEKDEILLEVLKENFKVEDNDGFVTSIEDKEQNPDENKYWTYTVNGDYGTVGANEYKLQKDDKVVFTLDKME